MKSKILFNLLVVTLLILALGASGQAQAREDEAISLGISLGTAFTYQGRLTDSGGNPSAGPCDFQFSLWDAAAGGVQAGSTLTKTSITLTNGYFSVSLDFGATAFQGDARYLQIAVRCPAGSGSYTTLGGRVELTAAPYALSLRPGASVQGTGTVLTLSTTATSGTGFNVVAPGATAIYGQSGGATGAGVYGVSTSSASTANGVAGVNTGNGVGVFGQTAAGRGVYGKAINLVEGYGVYSEGNAHVEGNLSWKAMTSYVSVSAAAFRPVDESYAYTNWGNTLDPKNLASRYYYAPVQLPHWAKVTRIRFYWSDLSADFNGRCYLYRNNFAAGGDTLGTVDTSGTGGPNWSETTTITNATVDNAQYAYYLGWDLRGGGDVEGYGVVIEYTVTGPY